MLYLASGVRLLRSLTNQDLISSEEVSCINFVLYISEFIGKTICNNNITVCLESVKIFFNFASKESIISQSWFINDNLCTFGFQALHDTLNRRLAEVIGVGLHSKAVYTDGNLITRSAVTSGSTVIISGFF